MKLLQISDLHFGTERPHVMQALLDWAQAQRPDVLVLSGDLTQRARRRQFHAARSFANALGVPQLCVLPGNHDIPLFNLAARGLAPYAGYRRAFGDVQRDECVRDDLLLLMVDTTRPWRHKHGELSVAQIERVAARLRQASAAQLRVVVTHHPCAVPHPSEADNLVRGHAAACKAWSAAGADLMLAGHIHWPALIPVGGATQVLLAGTAVSARVRREHGNSVNLIEWPSAPLPDAHEPAWTVKRFDHLASNRPGAPGGWELVAEHRGLRSGAPAEGRAPA